MKKSLLITLVLIAFTAVVAVGGKVYPNEKLLVGKWRPIKVEQVMPEHSGKQEMKKDTAATRPSAGQSALSGDDRLDKMMKAELKTMLEITGDRTAMKDYHGNKIKTTFKLKKGGTRIVARNIKTKEKYILNIVEVTDTQLVLIEKVQGAQLKITYVKQ